MLGFDFGKSVTAANGKPVYLEAVEGEKAKSIISQAKKIWIPFQQKLLLIIESKDALPVEKLDDAIV